MTAPADWLDLNRPSLPQRIKVEPYVGRHRAKDWDDTDFIPSPVPREPEWPTVELDFAPVSGVLPMKPRRWSRLWWRENLSFSRVFAGGASAVVLVGTAVGWLQ